MSFHISPNATITTTSGTFTGTLTLKTDWSKMEYDGWDGSFSTTFASPPLFTTSSSGFQYFFDDFHAEEDLVQQIVDIYNQPDE